MKIIVGNEAVLKVFMHHDQDISLDFVHAKYISYLTPLEAHELGTLLINLANETDYFKQLKKE